ncbi:MAG: phospholipase [Micavibrio aeruginosavorus]|uniref:Phospholipase n=1 Tax=Micavibrio aeruginosavorus TaxID=349221 RepID=A0A2W5A1M7_9BACT|nr:MAG: phospholipase [Micavibrio aeruginosavorus]
MEPVFQPGRNCWRTEKADYASVIVDYGNYYRDLRESIIRARRSIFLLGWDIDSRIELMRGKDAKKDEYPVTFFDLICWKAKENPEIQIYLNRWDYSMFFMRQREPFWEQKWKSCGLPNIHVCMDNVLPLSACHHQKIAVIDDEVAFWGGMDVALGRWDFRQHHVQNKHRADPAQLPHFHEKEHFAPYHDIQAVMAGPAARSLAEWVRIRWEMACPKTKPIAIAAAPETNSIPHCWPKSDPPDFENIDVALSRTMPAMQGKRQIEEIVALFRDEINQAENFIYIENQFLACREIAEMLNEQLRKKPSLRVLLVSCFDPNGVMERIAMWGGRVRFKDILVSGGVGDRVAMAYPASCENGKQAVVRIHSKLMIIDDKYLRIGSANINDRSMGMDTEFDVTLYGNNEASCAKIESVRNDLIREHTGYEIEEIQQIARNGDVQQLLEECPGSRQHLRRIDDEQYRKQPMEKIIYKLADPRRPLIHARWTRFPRFNKQQAIVLATAILFAASLAALWSWTPLAEYTDKENLSQLLENIRTAPLGLLWIIGIYVVSGIFFFPVTALSTAVVLIFGGLQGFLYATIGAICSALAGYAIGRAVGRERLLKIFPKAEKSMEKVRSSGVIGVTVIRMLPIAPFSLVNMIMGVIHLPLLPFVLGTFFGLSPGKIMLAIFGESFIEAFQNPDLQNSLYAAMGITIWVAVIFACNKFAKMWQTKHQAG